MREPTRERSHSSGQSVTRDSLCYKKTHERSHSGEIPFKCTLCDKSFSTSSYLETHETTQEGSHWSAPSVTRASQHQVTWRQMKPYRKEAIQVHKVWQVFLKIKFLEGAWEDPYRREAIQILQVHEDILFKQATWREMNWANPHRRGAFQMFLKCDKSISKSDHLEKNEQITL